jgi:hypothetical protein
LQIKEIPPTTNPIMLLQLLRTPPLD